MKRKLKVVLFTVIIFIAVFAIMQIFAPDKFLERAFKRSGTLRVDSTPLSNVFVNNVLIGQTPLQVTYPEGVYTVKFVPTANNQNTGTYTTTIRIFKNITTYLDRELAANDLDSSGIMLTLDKSSGENGQILVSTKPPGLFVSLDGEERGISPLFMDNVNAGEHDLGVRSEGLLSKSIKINIVRGYKLLADFQVAYDQEYKKKKEARRDKNAPPISEQQLTQLQILSADTGWLRVRSAPSLDASESAKVNTGDKFTYYNTQDGWYQIEYATGQRGWVNGEYVTILPTPTIKPSPTPIKE